MTESLLSTRPATDDLADRIFASLCLGGMGDALGAPTEQWTIDEIEEAYGGLVLEFRTPPSDTFAGANRGRRGEVTDDASQMYYLARALVAGGGELDHDGWVRCLLDWADTSPKASFMGPSTQGVVDALRRGQDVSRVGAIGDSQRKMTTIGNTNGAAMRVAPCGLLHPGRLEAACEQTFVTCLPSHDTDVAISAACSIAAGVARALVTPHVEAIVDACIEGAAIGEGMAQRFARSIAGPRFSARLEMALEIAGDATDDRLFLREIEARVGNSVLAAESVPAAIAVFAYAEGDPLRTIALASSIGNDTDSIATMAGSLAGAMGGTDALPPTLFAEFFRVNDPEYDLRALALGLARFAERRYRAG